MMEDFEAVDAYCRETGLVCEMEESGAEFDFYLGDKYSTINLEDAERFYEWLGKALGK